MRADTNENAVLKEAADLYVKREGERLELELAAMADAPDYAPPYPRLRLRAALRDVRRVAYIAAPLAACLLVAFLYTRPFGTGSPSGDGAPADDNGVASSAATEAPAAPAAPERAEVAFLSAKLPAGYSLTATDYDGDRTIYHIASETGGEVVLVAEWGDGFDTYGFTLASISGGDVYVKTRRGYSVLLAAPKEGGLVYTLTSPYDAEDLVKIAAAIM